MPFSLLTEVQRIPDVNHFFIGWPNRPSQAQFEQLLRNADLVTLAVDNATQTVIGFATAITDHVLSAYIPLIEVHPDYQDMSVGTAMINNLLQRLSSLYMIDLVCDESLVPYYTRFGMKRGIAMSIRRYNALS